MFEITDDKAYARFIFLELTSVYSNGNNSWRCETEDGRYLNVREKGGIIHMAIGETENDLINEYIVLNIKNIKTNVDNPYDFDVNKIKALASIGQIKFDKIKDYMGWAVEANNVWDS
jgi:hypothetical protein